MPDTSISIKGAYLSWNLLKFGDPQKTLSVGGLRFRVYRAAVKGHKMKTVLNIGPTNLIIKSLIEFRDCIHYVLMVLCQYNYILALCIMCVCVCVQLQCVKR